jgi:hypothetical protein
LLSGKFCGLRGLCILSDCDCESLGSSMRMISLIVDFLSDPEEIKNALQDCMTHLSVEVIARKHQFSVLFKLHAPKSLSPLSYNVLQIMIHFGSNMPLDQRLESAERVK